MEKFKITFIIIINCHLYKLMAKTHLGRLQPLAEYTFAAFMLTMVALCKPDDLNHNADQVVDVLVKLLLTL